jgi:hypothetical protein
MDRRQDRPLMRVGFGCLSAILPRPRLQKSDGKICALMLVRCEFFYTEAAH